MCTEKNVNSIKNMLMNLMLMFKVNLSKDGLCTF